MIKSTNQWGAIEFKRSFIFYNSSNIQRTEIKQRLEITNQIENTGENANFHKKSNLKRASVIKIIYAHVLTQIYTYLQISSSYINT